MTESDEFKLAPLDFSAMSRPADFLPGRERGAVGDIGQPVRDKLGRFAFKGPGTATCPHCGRDFTIATRAKP